MEETIFGINPVLEMLKSQPERVHQLFLAHGTLKGKKKLIFSLARQHNIKIHLIPRSRFNQIAGNEAHQGVVGIILPYSYQPLEALLENWKRSREKALFLILDGITDPQNFGAIARSACTVGAHGIIVSKHITVGEVIGDESEIFIISDLSTVWVDLSVYQKDLAYIQKGQTAVIATRHGVPEIKGEISYVGQIVGEDTRTALARIVIPNPQEQYRPGIFVTAKVTVDEIDVPLLVPKSSLQIVEGNTCVFIQDGDGFEPHSVELGRTNETFVEVISGLAVGQRYVTKGAFTLKAQLSKGSFGDGHGH